MTAPAPTELLKLADELRDSEVEEILDTDLLERVEAALRQAASVGAESGEAKRVTGCFNQVEEAACLIWDELCPGMVMGDADLPHYEAAAKAVLALASPSRSEGVSQHEVQTGAVAWRWKYRPEDGWQYCGTDHVPPREAIADRLALLALDAVQADEADHWIKLLDDGKAVLSKNEMREISQVLLRLRGAAQASPMAIENEQLRKTIQLHAGDAMSLSNELDEWRARALAAEEALALSGSCTCGGEPGQPANEHDISCPAALSLPSAECK